MSTKPPRPANSAPSIISADVRLKGDLVTSGEVQFDGTIEGDLKAGSLIVGESATVSGTVTADTVTVHGQVNGTIRATTVRLEKSSKMVGDVIHTDLAIASGAHVEGHFMHTENAKDAKPGSEPAKPIAGPSGANAEEPKAANS
ncbi:MAG: polymer-forming cytoskeletal protein [Alphaproteobacteria bacterium]|nr:polymer-forming cytoskeletal protein [Alphaproteobacteria bacterium]